MAKKETLEYCGISPVKVIYISSVNNLTSDYRDKWLKKISQLGEKLK